MIFIYLALALLISAMGALTDIRFGYVSNRHLIMALVIWIILMLIEAIFLSSPSVNILPRVLNAVLAFIAAIIFYLTDIWAPGDCKLYITVSLIFPVQAYAVQSGNIFPALNFIIYAFAAGYIALLALFIIRLAKGNAAMSDLRPKRINIISVIANLGIIALINILFELYSPEFFYSNQILCVLSAIALICMIYNKFDKIRKIVGLIGLLFLIVCSSWQNILMSLVNGLIAAFIIEFINNNANINKYREIVKDDVRPGMILSYSTILAMQKCIDPELPHITTENRRSRITERQAEAVRNWCKNAKSNVIIVEMMPFAPFIALSVLIQIIRFLILGN